MTEEQTRLLLQFITENHVLWLIVILIGMVLLGRSVPKETVEQLKTDAQKTTTPVDDTLVAILALLQEMKTVPQATPPMTVAPSRSYVDELRQLSIPQAPPTITIAPQEVKRQPPNVAVNRNSRLAVLSSGMGNWGDEAKRAKDTPDEYEIFWQPFMAGDSYAPPPEIRGKDTGLDVALSHRRGRLFIHQELDTTAVQPGQRYLLAVRCNCDLKLKADADIRGAIVIKAQLLNGEAVMRNLNAWSPTEVDDLSGEFRALWALETNRTYQNLSYQVVVEVGNMHAVPFDDLSKIVITAIELMPVAADYGNENLVRF